MKSNRDKIVRVPVHRVALTTLAAGAGSLQCAPAQMSTRANAIADDFAEYRIVSLKYRLHPNGTRTAMQGLCYIPGVTDTAPATLSAISETMDTIFLGVSATTPTAWHSVGLPELKGYNVWYKTVAGTPETATEQPGSVYMIGAGTEVVAWEFFCVFEFRGGVDNSVTPAVRAFKAQVAEKQRLLRILSTPDTMKDSTDKKVGSSAPTGGSAGM